MNKIAQTLIAVVLAGACLSLTSCDLPAKTSEDKIKGTVGTVGTVADPPIVLKDYGFSNMLNMYQWLAISDYDFEGGYVKFSEQSKFDGLIFSNGYVLRDQRDENGKLIGIGTSATKYGILNNNVKLMNNGDSISIIERVIHNRWMILKASYNDEQEWYIPTNMIDWDKSPKTKPVDGTSRTEEIYYLQK